MKSKTITWNTLIKKAKAKGMLPFQYIDWLVEKSLKTKKIQKA